MSWFLIRVTDISGIFVEFCGLFSFVWSEDCDDFDADHLYERGNGGARILTVIRDTIEYICRGLRPIASKTRVWERQSDLTNNHRKVDQASRSLTCWPKSIFLLKTCREKSFTRNDILIDQGAASWCQHLFHYSLVSHSIIGHQTFEFPLSELFLQICLWITSAHHMIFFPYSTKLRLSRSKFSKSQDTSCAAMTITRDSDESIRLCRMEWNAVMFSKWTSAKNGTIASLHDQQHRQHQQSLPKLNLEWNWKGFDGEIENSCTRSQSSNRIKSLCLWSKTMG